MRTNLFWGVNLEALSVEGKEALLQMVAWDAFTSLSPCTTTLMVLHKQQLHCYSPSCVRARLAQSVCSAVLFLQQE